MKKNGRGTQEALTPEQQSRKIRAMFSGIAERYDFLNRLLSLGIDTRWRKRCIRVLRQSMKTDGPILDLAAGTGDLALALDKRTSPGFRVVAADFSLEMLKILKMKRGPSCGILIVTADGLSLPFRTGMFSGATIGFGIRNFTDRSAALRELNRVLKPGGILAILEFSIPRGRLLRFFYLLYFEKILPLIGGVFSSRSAYSYLPESVRKFPPPETFTVMIRNAGFKEVQASPLTGGIAVLYTAEKPLIDPSGKTRSGRIP